MSATIQTQIAFVHIESGLNASAAWQTTTIGSAFSSDAIEVLAVDETVGLGDITTPQQVFVKLVSGDDLLVGLASGTYPFRLKMQNNAGEALILRLDVEGLLEISTVQTEPDVNNSLDGTYFDIHEASDALVRVWFSGPGLQEITTIQVLTVTGIGGKYFDLYDSAGEEVRVWIDVDDLSTPPATPAGGRLLEVDVTAADTVADVAALISAALESDAQFSATDDTVDTVTATAATPGARVNGVSGDAGVFTVTVTQGGTASASAPASGGGRLVQVDFALNDTAATIAAALNMAFASDTGLTATYDAGVDDDLVTFTDKNTGTRTDRADTGATGFTFPAVTQQGAASPVVHLKSTGTSQVVAAVAPY